MEIRREAIHAWFQLSREKKRFLILITCLIHCESKNDLTILNVISGYVVRDGGENRIEDSKVSRIDSDSSWM